MTTPNTSSDDPRTALAMKLGWEWVPGWENADTMKQTAGFWERPDGGIHYTLPSEDVLLQLLHGGRAPVETPIVPPES